jgi:hypothetical protein
MDTVCPVTRAYLYAVRNLYDFSLIQHETYAEPLQELIERASHDNAARVRQHQRAFYCLELMVFRFVVKVRPGYYIKETEKPVLSWSRSREGLNHVLKYFEEKRDDILAEVTEYYYLPDKKLNTDQLRHADNQTNAELYKLICEACVLLRQSLRNPEVPLSRVGKRLALAANVSRHYIGDMLAMGDELLLHTEGTTRRAWQIPTT